MRTGSLIRWSMVLVFTVTAVAAGNAVASAPTGTAALQEDAFTAVVVTPIGSRHVAVTGTDGMAHVVYELELTNTKPATATVQQVEILDADAGAGNRVLASWSGAILQDHLRTLQPAPADALTIPFNQNRLLYVQLAFKPDAVPRALIHRFQLLAAPNPGPHAAAMAQRYTVARVDISRAPLPVIQPPLRGDGWVAANGCCNSDIPHRGSLQSVNGALYNSQRFAIDWMRRNREGELVHGDPADVRSYVDYGARVYAVADGTVVGVLDDLDDQVPGKLPDPASITLRTVDGNHVIIAIGHGLYAFYAHLQKGSVTVHLGERVKAGTVIGLLGNTGNTSAPHLHFHVMDSPSAMGSEGMPYVIDDFKLAGQVNIDRFNRSDVLTGRWGKLLQSPMPQRDRFPLNLNIIDFPSR